MPGRRMGKIWERAKRAAAAMAARVSPYAAEDEFFGERRRDNEQEKGGDGRFGDAEIELGVEERKAHH